MRRRARLQLTDFLSLLLALVEHRHGSSLVSALLVDEARPDAGVCPAKICLAMTLLRRHSGILRPLDQVGRWARLVGARGSLGRRGGRSRGGRRRGGWSRRGFGGRRVGRSG